VPVLMEPKSISSRL